MKFTKQDDKYIISIAPGEKLIEEITKFSDEKGIKNASFIGLGAASHVEIAHYDVGTKKYSCKKLDKAFEISNITGNIFIFEGRSLVHAHITLADSEFNTVSGHLVDCTISAACEIVLTSLSSAIEKKLNDKIGLKLLDL